MLIFNCLVSCICIWGIASVCNRFIRLTTINRYRFGLFALRDRLALLVLQKKVATADDEYLTLLRLLNTSINVFDENCSFAGYFRFLSKLVSNKALLRDVESMIKRLRMHKSTELALIACEYFELNRLIFNKYTRRTPLSLLISLLSFTAFTALQLRKHIELKEKIDSSLENSLQQLRAVCA